MTIFPRSQRRRIGVVWAGIIGVTLPISNVITGIDKDAKLPFWELNSAGLSLRLVQRLPEQTRAFFAARGFDKHGAEQIAQSCVFQTVVRNSLPAGKAPVVEYDLTHWTILHLGRSKRLKTREQWRQLWQQRKIGRAARIAFEWSLLPTKQRYQPQDYNWGMTSYNLPPGSKFDLTVVWRLDGIEKSAVLKNIECAADIHLEPGDV